MTRWRMAAVAAGILGTVGLGTAIVRGQPRAVPIKQLRALDLVTGGSRIGVSIRDVEDADAKSVEAGTSGVVVEDVSANSPAEKAGIRKGDVIVEFDGERVRSARQLTRLVQETPSGRSVRAVVLRDGHRTSLTVTPSSEGSYSFGGFDRDRLGDLRFRVVPRPPAPPMPPTPPSVWRFEEWRGRAGRLGIAVTALSPQLAEYFGTKRGVLVSSVTDDSAAANAGVKAGDVITSWNGSAVDDPADVRRQIQNLRDGDEFTIEVMRDRKPLTLKGRVERTERRPGSRTTL